MRIPKRTVGCAIGLAVFATQLATAETAHAQLLRRFFETPSATDGKSPAPTSSAAKQLAPTGQINHPAVKSPPRPSPNQTRTGSPYPQSAAKTPQSAPATAMNRNVNPYSANRGSAYAANANPRSSTATAKSNRPLPTPTVPLSQNRPGVRPSTQSPAQASAADAYFGSGRSQPRPDQSSFAHGPVQQPVKSSVDRSTVSSSSDSNNNGEPTASLVALDDAGQEAALKPLDMATVQQRFGMSFDSAADQLVIDRLDANGNAQAAGLKAGDTIAEVGGAPIRNVKELAEIAGLLSEGDQIELTVTRDGQEQKLLTQFGKSREAPAGELNIGELSQTDSSAGNGWVRSTNNAELKQLVEEQREMISRLQQRIRELEEAQKGNRSSF